MPLLGLGLALALVALVARVGRSRTVAPYPRLAYKARGVVKRRSLAVASFQDFSSASLNGRPCCTIIL